jgi:polyisoprenoid-binding protein YceI
MRWLALLLLLNGLAPAGAAEFAAVNPQQSSIGFVSTQMGVPVEGRFGKFDAHLAIDPTKPESGTAHIDVDIKSIDVGSQDANEEVVGPAWFDAAKYPAASFAASNVTRLPNGSYRAIGKLTIRNVTREVNVPFTLTQKGSLLVIDGSLPIKRLDYGIGSGIWSDTDTVANEVQIRFHFTLASKS